MIKANELRIGNWVELKNSGNVKVEADNIGDIVNNLAIFNPIPITPEILEKIGFNKRKINNTFWEYFLPCTPPGYKATKKHKLVYWDANQERCIQWKPEESGAIHEFPCDRLHQLQNLYFALTGTELNIEL